MTPRVAILSRHADGTLRDAQLHGLPLSEHIIALRFDGQLYFANVPYFEDALLAAVAAHPGARQLLIVGDGINQLDASGEEMIRNLVERLHATGVSVVFSGLKQQVLQVMRQTGLYDFIGEDNMFRTRTTHRCICSSASTTRPSTAPRARCAAPEHPVDG